MQVTTAHNIGDEIYFIYENVVCKSVVKNIRIDNTKSTLTIKYYTVDDIDSNMFITEDKCFKTKEDLIASL